MTQQFGSGPGWQTTPERPRYVLLVSDPERETKVSLPGQHRGVAQAGLFRSAEVTNVVMPPTAPVRSRGGHRHRTAWTADDRRQVEELNGALAPQRPGARVGATREAHGPDGGRPARLGLAHSAAALATALVDAIAVCAGSRRSGRSAPRPAGATGGSRERPRRRWRPTRWTRPT